MVSGRVKDGSTIHDAGRLKRQLGYLKPRGFLAMS